MALVVLFAQFAGAYGVSCSDIWVDTEDISIESDDLDYFFFKIHNEADKRFSVLEVEAWSPNGMAEHFPGGDKLDHDQGETHCANEGHGNTDL